MSAAWLGGWARVSALGAQAPEAAWPAVGAAEWAGRYPYAPVDPGFDFDALSGLGAHPEARQMDPLTRYVVACARLLPQSAGHEPERTGIIMGTAFGCSGSNHQFLETLVARGPRRVAPVVFRNTVSNAFAGHLATLFAARGSNSVLNSGMVAGLQACAYAFEELRRERCTRILTGSCDCSSPVAQRRFLQQEQRYGVGPLPLLDGACATWITARPVAPGWRLAGYALGTLGGTDPEGNLARLLTAAAAHAGVEWPAVDAVQAQAARSAGWERNGTPAAPRELAEELLSRAGRPPFQENSSLTTMLALAACLQTLPAGRWPALFADPGPHPGRAQVPRWLLFAGVGGDANAVVLALEHAPEARA